MWRKLLILQLILIPQWVLGHGFGARIDQASWHLDPSPLKCRLWQAVPNYGDAVFEVEAGQPLTFYIDSYRPVTRSGKAQMSIVAPNWRADINAKPIGNTALRKGKRPIELAEEVANQLLAELYGGMYPSFTHPGWYGQHSVTVDVSAVNFQSAYEGYVSCVAGLFPASFSDLKHSLLHFETNKYGIKGKLKERLEKDGAMMNESEREKLTAEFQEKVKEFNFLKQRLDSTVAQRKQAFVERARPEVDAAVEELLKENDLDLILPSEAVVYVKPELNLTPQLLEKLNR